ncbi:uncharacterized protein [Onthophagus taurus]|uniref:uncharacterized protein n=1 Tax=Onthophagus taurus TaxID=166361 RepID=UPI0039BEA462
MNSARIKKIVYDESSLRPIIGNFQNGIIQPSTEDKLSCGLFKDNITNNTNAIITSDRGFYNAVINRDEDSYNNFIVICNKKKGTCKFIAVDKVTFDFSLNKNKLSPDVNDTEANKSTVSDLIKKFGSKKQRKFREQSERMQLDVQTMKEQFEQVVDETHIDEADLAPHNPENLETSYKPPINRDAENVKDVYPLESLVPLNVLSELEEEVNSLLNEENDELKVTSEFVKRELLKLQKSSLTQQDILKAEIFLYIEYLIKYIKLPAKCIAVRKYQPCEYSQILSEHIFKQFSISTSTGKMRPLSMRDKCLCYILVLGIIGCDYTMSIELLSKDLKQGIKKLQELCKILSFTPLIKDKTVVTLKLPLPTPPSHQAMNKKRKR